MAIQDSIRTIPDYPKPGIMFRDITPLFGDPSAFHEAVEGLTRPYVDARVAKVAGIEARGFVLGGAVAFSLGAGFVPLRKPGKLPFDTHYEEYSLEYGTDALHMHVDAVEPGQRVLLVDDLIATGGTAVAAARLLERNHAEIVGAAFVIDLPDLGGADKVRALGIEVISLMSFEGY